MTELNISWTDLSAQGLDLLCSSAPRGLERLCLAGYRDTLQEYRNRKLNFIDSSFRKHVKKQLKIQ